MSRSFGDSTPRTAPASPRGRPRGCSSAIQSSGITPEPSCGSSSTNTTVSAAASASATSCRAWSGPIRSSSCSTRAVARITSGVSQVARIL
jgi:hypothetical protein